MSNSKNLRRFDGLVRHLHRIVTVIVGQDDHDVRRRCWRGGCQQQCGEQTRKTKGRCVVESWFCSAEKRSTDLVVRPGAR